MCTQLKKKNRRKKKYTFSQKNNNSNNDVMKIKFRIKNSYVKTVLDLVQGLIKLIIIYFEIY